MNKVHDILAKSIIDGMMEYIVESTNSQESVDLGKIRTIFASLEDLPDDTIVNGVYLTTKQVSSNEDLSPKIIRGRITAVLNPTVPMNCREVIKKTNITKSQWNNNAAYLVKAGKIKSHGTRKHMTYTLA